VSVDLVYETHSTSVDNERGIATGWLEGSLSETGRLQAAGLGDRRRDDGLYVVFTSDLRRATQTAEIAFAGSPIPIQSDRRLRECNYGSMNGLPREQVEAERRRRLDEPYPGGESWRQAVERVADFLQGLRPSYVGRRVLIIGHVATKWALDHVVLGIPLEQLVEGPFEWQEGWEYTLVERPRG
jgi:broad specificity phosphatase PhoE